jgi:hypothetical protein
VSDGIIAISDGADVGVVAVEPVFGSLTVEGIVIIGTFASVTIDAGSQITDCIITISAGFAELVGVGFAAIEGVVGVSGGIEIGIGNGDDVANFVVGDLRQAIFSIFDLDAAIEGVVGVLCPIGVGIDGGGDVA